MMTTQLFTTITLSIAALSCENITDFSAPYPVQVAEDDTGETMVNISADYFLVQFPNEKFCMRIQSEHMLLANAIIEPLDDAEQDILHVARQADSKLVLIDARGDGMSDRYGQGHTELQLTLNTLTYHLSGYLITRFGNGEVTEMFVEGQSHPMSEGPTSLLAADIGHGSLTVGLESLRLTDGEILIEMPSQPVAWFEMRLSVTGAYMTPEVNLN